MVRSKDLNERRSDEPPDETSETTAVSWTDWQRCGSDMDLPCMGRYDEYGGDRAPYQRRRHRGASRGNGIIYHFLHDGIPAIFHGVSLRGDNAGRRPSGAARDIGHGPIMANSSEEGLSMSKTVSAGVVLFNERRELLLCHATETRHWDIPKGMGDPGESARDAALRETREETGLILDPSRLTDVGQFDDRSDKALHLFGLRTAAGEVDPSTCVCTSFFPSRRSGRSIPEMDEFAWVAIADIGRLASGSLNRLFAEVLPLPALFERLPAPPSSRTSGDPFQIPGNPEEIG